jgi:predicted aspartyl protease
MAASYRCGFRAAIAACLAIGIGAGPSDAGPAPASSAPAESTEARLERALFPGRRPDDLAAVRIVAEVERAGIAIGRAETRGRRAPRRLRESLSIGGVTQAVTVIGDRAWREDANAAVRLATGDERSSFLLSHLLLFHGWIGGEADGFAIELGATEVEVRPAAGGPARTIELEEVPGEDGVSRLLPVRLRERQQGADLVTTFSDWRVVDGVRFPFRSVQRTDDPRFDLGLRVVSLEVLEEPPSDAWEVPRPGRPDDASLVDPARAASIPLRFAGTIPIVDVVVNGTAPRPFLVDTGAAASVLDRKLVAALGLETRGGLEARGAGGSAEAAYVRVATLALPGVELRDQILLTVPLGALAAVVGTEIGGILGWDFLSRFAVEIDWSGARLALARPGEYVPPPGAIRVPVRVEMNVPLVEVRADDLPPADFLVDTGNAATVFVHSPWARRHGFGSDDAAGREAWGLGGSETLREATLARIAVGEAAWTDVPVLVGTADRGIAALDEAAGNLGSGLFAGGRIALDYSAGSLWITPAQAASASER